MPPLSTLLDCHAWHYPRHWQTLHDSLLSRPVESWTNEPLVSWVVAHWSNRSQAGCAQFQGVILGADAVSSLRGFCPLGYVTALYAAGIAAGNTTLVREAERCAAFGGAWWGWNLLVESRWGKLLHPWTLHAASRPWKRSRRKLEAPLDEEVDGSSVDGYSPVYLPQLHAYLTSISAAGGAGTTRQCPHGPTGLTRQTGQRFLTIGAFGVHAPTLLEPVFAFHEVRPPGTNTQVVLYGASHPPIAKLLSEVCPEVSEKDELRCWESPRTSKAFWTWIDERPSLAEGVKGLEEVLRSDPFFRITDLLVCGGGHSPTLCMILRMASELPMYFTLQAPLAFRMPRGHELRSTLVSIFRSMSAGEADLKGHTLVSTSLLFLQRQIWAQFACLLPVVRNHNLYVPIAQAADFADEVIFWQNHVSLKAPCAIGIFRILKEFEETFRWRFVFKNMAGMPSYREWRRLYAIPKDKTHMSYAEIGTRFVAAVVFPHDLGMISFDDLYRMGVPVFMPTNDMVSTMAFAHLVSTVNYPWYLLRREHASLRSNHARGAPPWNISGPDADSLAANQRDLYLGRRLQHVEKLELLSRISNFNLFPHVTRFGSLRDLVAQLNSADLSSISAAMRAFSVKTWQATAEYYRQAARRLCLPHVINDET